MAKIKTIDVEKYMEKNYSSNIFTLIGEEQEDVRQAKKLASDAELWTEFMESLKEQAEEHHYLVDDAILTCTRCSEEPDDSYGESFCVPEGISERKLVVTQNSTAKNGAGQCFATVNDSEKNVNIFPFGNCKNPPDRDKEREALLYASENEEFRKLGTCFYLMNLNDQWENLVSDTGYEKIPGEDGKLLETITMEAILFCKHGGFIYPRHSGYIETDVEEEEEVLEEDKKTEEEIMALLKELGVSDYPDVAIYVWKFFREKGLSEYAVAGILGNIYAETEEEPFKPDTQRGENYYGIFQIGPGKDKLFEKGGDGKDGEGWKKVEVQCAFAWDEYSTRSDTGWMTRYLDMGNYLLAGTKENFINASSASEAALIWATSFERCYLTKGNTDDVFLELQGQEKRVEKAEEMYEIFKGTEWE